MLNYQNNVQRIRVATGPFSLKCNVISDVIVTLHVTLRNALESSYILFSFN